MHLHISMLTLILMFLLFIDEESPVGPGPGKTSKSVFKYLLCWNL